MLGEKILWEHLLFSVCIEWGGKGNRFMKLEHGHSAMRQLTTYLLSNI